MVCPCAGPGCRVRRISMSRVPCKNAMGSSLMGILGEEYDHSPRMSRGRGAASAIPQAGGRTTGSALIWRELAAEGRHCEIVKSFGGRKGLDNRCCVVDFLAWWEYNGSGVRTDTGKTGSTHRGDLTEIGKA